MKYKIVSVRDVPDYLGPMVDYYTSKWNLNKDIWHGLISECITTQSPLPRWYLMVDGEDIVGCIGLMVDDAFNPTIAGLYIEESLRGEELGGSLLERVLEDAKEQGLARLHLQTYHKGYFEKYGWNYHGNDPENKVRDYVIDLL
ncbi:MAG: GNAT family N-acetyltransferase [Defluviitaleaceae bacterium]|nr:GNAT family N-acetyltransferase [Defluviitaleaceae bacterium]